MDEKIIKVEVEFCKQFYPKYNETIEDGDFGIVSWKVMNVIEGDPVLHPLYKTITTKGNMCAISRLETYTVVAKEAPNNYGMQYDLLYIGQHMDLSNTDKQKVFLEKILTKKQVEEMFKVFDNPISIIEDENIDELVKIKGVGEVTAYDIINKYKENKDYSKAYIELDGYGLTNNMIQKIIEKYVSPDIAIKKIKNNPYILANEIKGIGFTRADEIALNSGLQHDSIERISSFIQYYLEQEAENGNSYVYANYLMYEIEDCLGSVEDEKIGKAMNILTNQGVVGLMDDESGYKRVYLTKYKNLEQKVCNELLRLTKGKNKFTYAKWEDRVKKVEKQQGWTHTQEQWKGIQTVLENQVVIITGIAGTGKSSIVSAMLKALESNSYSFAQTALSGRASAKLQEVTKEEGQTIHRLLGFNPQRGFYYNKKNKLPLDLVILDEISLVGGRIFLRLIEAIEDDTKLIIIGDDGQLESIGCMNLARDLIESEAIPVVRLTEPHRQAKKSGTITESIKIRNGEQLFDRDFEGVDIRGELQDFELCITQNKDKNKQHMVEYFTELYPRVNDIMDIQLLVPVKERGDCSVSTLNNEIQAIYNPPSSTKNEVEVTINKKQGKKHVLREQDKVMVLKNNYKTQNTDEEVTAIFNGWLGIIKKVDDIEDKVYVYFPIIHDTIVIPFKNLKDIQLGYASTIHKFQGSSAKIIIGGIDYSTPPFMRTRELVYTLVTRAEDYCVLVAQNGSLRESINTSGVINKNTFLKKMLQNK